MAWKIKWTQAAANDLEKAVKFIANDSPRYATSFANEVLTASRSLDLLAKRGHVVPELQDSNIRELFVMNYRLIYQISPNTLYVLGLIHGARDLWVLWEKDQRK